jgi:hypothetical protein
MQRRQFIIALTAFSMAFPGAALADYADSVVAQLTVQGYRDIDVTRTLLGRTRIVATSDQGTRELVINPRTGELLRDVWMTNSGRTSPSPIAESISANDQRRSDDEDRDDHNDGEDDDDRDDHGGDDHGGDDRDDGDRDDGDRDEDADDHGDRDAD